MLTGCKTVPEVLACHRVYRRRQRLFSAHQINNSSHRYGVSYVFILKTRLALVGHYASQRVINHGKRALHRSTSCANQTQLSFATLVNTHAVAREIAVALPTTGIVDTGT
jgi:hypothetical protein